MKTQRKNRRINSKFSVEALERRDLLAADWMALDVSGNGAVGYYDAALTMRHYATEAPSVLQLSDVDRDGNVSPADTLAIINQLSDREADGAFNPRVTDDHVNSIGADATVVDLVNSNGALVGDNAGRFESQADIDVFQFSVATADVFRFNFFAIVPDVMTVDIVDENLNTITSLTSNGIFDAQYVETALDAGTHYIVATSVGSQAVGEYFFQIQLGDFDPPQPPVDDHADVIGPQATPIPLVDDGTGLLTGQAQGVIGEAGDVDVFQFDVPQDGRANVDFLSLVGGGTEVRLLDVSGSVIESLTTQFILQTEFETVLTAGTYYLSVTAADGVSVGEYFFGVKLGDIDDHADQIGPDATVVNIAAVNGQLRGSAQGQIETAGDVDVFQFEIAQPDELSFELLMVGSGAEVRADLLDDSGDLIATTTSGATLPGTFTETLGRGTYFVTVESAVPGGLTEYTFKVALATPFDDHSDQIGPAATKIDLFGGNGALVGNGGGQLERSGDVDVFQFTAAMDATIRLDFFGVQTSVNFAVVDAAGTVLASGDSAFFLPGQLDLEVSAGTYYVVASASDGVSGGAYIFSVHLDENPGNDRLGSAVWMQQPNLH